MTTACSAIGEAIEGPWIHPPTINIRPPPSLIWLDPFFVAGLGLAPVVAMIPSNMKLSTGTSALENRHLALIVLRMINPRG